MKTFTGGVNEWSNLARRMEIRAPVTNLELPDWAELAGHFQGTRTAEYISQGVQLGKKNLTPGFCGWRTSGCHFGSAAAWRKFSAKSFAPVPPAERSVHPIALKYHFQPVTSREQETMQLFRVA